MKIGESTVVLSASREAERSRVIDVSLEHSFHNVFKTLATSNSDSQSELRQRISKLLQTLIEAIMAVIDGKKCPENIAAGQVAAADPDPVRGGSELSWHCKITETVCEYEKTSVRGSGRVKTCDGKEIEFNYALEMARRFQSEKVFEDYGSVVLRDPLVLSFDGKASELTDIRQSFDLDSDGKAESIPGLGSSSGYLVFDRNANGKADDGSELFGAKSGNGFADLAAFDLDHNGWIDEADPVFSQLAVWSGESWNSLVGRGVGALYTSAVDAPFSLKDSGNGLLGEIRAAGIYLTEAGSVGAMQQVDLAVSALPAGQQQPDDGQKLAT